MSFSLLCRILGRNRTNGLYKHASSNQPQSTSACDQTCKCETRIPNDCANGDDESGGLLCYTDAHKVLQHVAEGEITEAGPQAKLKDAST